MKNFLLLSVSVLLSVYSIAQTHHRILFNEDEKIPFKEPFTHHDNTRDLTYLPLQSQEYTWDASNWYNNADHHYSYDPVTCLLLTDTAFFSGTNGFINVYGYDSILAVLPPEEAFPSEETTYSWNGSNWVYYSRYSFTFYPQGYLHAYAFSNYDPVAQQWDTISASIRIRTFDTDNDPIDMVRQKYNTATHQYENDYKEIFQYYSPGYLSGYDWYEWASNQFVLTFRLTNQTYNYYTDPQYYQINYSLEQDWIVNNWVDIYQTFYTYDSNNSQFYNEMVWNGGTWENGYVSGFIYDSHGNEIENYDSSWNGVGYELVYMDKFLLTYGSNGELEESIYQYADAYSPLQNYTKFEYSDFAACNQPTAIGEETEDETVVVYPNPSKESFTIFWKGLNTNEHQLRVMDILGRVVFQSTLAGSSGSSMVYLPNIATGNYLLVIEDGKEKRILQMEIMGE